MLSNAKPGSEARAPKGYRAIPLPDGGTSADERACRREPLSPQVMMCSYIRRIAYLEYCEDELARLVTNSITRGHLTADETRKLRVVAGELLLLDRDIPGSTAATASKDSCLAPARPGATIH